MTKHRKRIASGQVRFGRALAFVAAAAAVLALGASDAGAAARAGKNLPGPVLTTPAAELAEALSCPQGVRGKRLPVLLVPGAGGDPGFAFSAGLEPVLRANRFPVCTVALPDAAMSDNQIIAEYLVASIRRMSARSGRPVSVVGVSQGGMLARWALKWWPDVRSLVGDVVGLAPDNHGIAPSLAAVCNVPCPPATRQQVPGSQFLAALDGGDETPGRLSYSVISSATDVNVPPPSPTLMGERDDSNTQVQEVCPGREVDHAHIGYDAVAVALVLDALGHRGPARASRIPATTCAETYADAVDPGEVERQVTAGDQHFAANYSRAGLTDDEPALQAYATQPAPQPTATVRISPHRLRAGRGIALSIVASGRSGRDRWALPRARITVAGQKTITNQKGRASLRLRMSHPSSLPIRLTAPGLGPATIRVRL